MEPIQVRGRLTVSDVRRFQYFHMLRRLWWLVAVFIFLIVMDFATYGNLTAGSSWILGMLLLFWAAVPWYSASRALKTRPHLAEEIAYIFTPAGVAMQAESSAGSFKWSVVREVYETKSAFLLYDGRVIARILPRRYFESPEHLAAWRSAVAGWIQPKTIKPPGFVGRWI